LGGAELLDVALKFLTAELNTYLLTRTDSDFGEAELCRVVDDSGKWAVKEDHLGVSVINVEEERTVRSQLPDRVLVDGRLVTLEPELKLNLHVIVTANFKNYDQALKYISHVLTFFQSRTAFTHEQYPSLDARIDKLSAELLSLNYEQLNQIWAFLGGKQLPSVIYKIRMVVLQDVAQSSVQPPLTRISTTTRSK
jgi:hypothetical protein